MTFWIFPIGICSTCTRAYLYIWKHWQHPHMLCYIHFINCSILSFSPYIYPFPVPNISFAFYKPGFFSKLIESHQVMAEVSTIHVRVWNCVSVQLGFVSIKFTSEWVSVCVRESVSALFIHLLNNLCVCMSTSTCSDNTHSLTVCMWVSERVCKWVRE